MRFEKNVLTVIHNTTQMGRLFSLAIFGGLTVAGLLGGQSLQAAGGYTTNTIQFSSYGSRTALLNGGWSFWATNASGVGRNTEITDTNVGPRIIFRPADNPGALRIPADTGMLLLGQNDSRNCLFRNLVTNWVSLRLKITFSPTQSFQEANLMVYQDDNSFVWIGHSFSGNERVRFGREYTGLLLDNYYQVKLLDNPVSDIHLRLDRDPETDRISGLYSLDGNIWANVGNFSQSFSNPRLGIFAGGSPGGFPNCDLIQLQVVRRENPVEPAFVVPAQGLVFNTIAGQPVTNVQAVNVALRSLQSAPVNWTLTNSAPEWFWTSATNGNTPASCDVSPTAAITNLAPGTYQTVLGFGAPGVTGAVVNVTLIVNPANRARVATWQDGKKGAMTVSVDDSKTSGFYELVTNGLAGSYMLMQGPQAPVFNELYQAGMELGAHTLSHPCVDVGAATIRGELEGNIAGIIASTPMPPAQLISLAWPCGVASVPYQIVAADYFLCARGYNFNQLEETTPYDFMNLKSFNSHENAPFPPADFKTLVDAAEAQGKWFNLVLHNFTNDDGAIAYAAGRDVWVAPLGAVVKYIHQRDRIVITDYNETTDYIQFDSYRLPLSSSGYRSFETVFTTNDVLTFQVDITGAPAVSAVFVDGGQIPFSVDGNTLSFKTRVTTNSQSIILDLSPNTPPVLPSQNNRAVNELATLIVTNAATDADTPAQAMTYTLAVTNALDGSVVTNVQISSVGTITWTPSEAHGLGNYVFTTVVTDFATPPLSATNVFTVIVYEINVAPVLSNQPSRTIVGPVTFQVTNSAMDADLPVNSFSYSLTVTNLGDNSAVLNATIDANGIITWTPTAGQVGTTNRLTTIVTDTNPAAFNEQHLSATNVFTVIVRPYPLALPGQPNQVVNELALLQVTNTALVVAPDLLTGWLTTNTISFNYSNREALLADGWSFIGRDMNGLPRDTEVTNASVGLISYAQTNSALGPVLRVPCDVGDLWMGLNNTTNSLFRAVPTNWVSAQLRLSFAMFQNYMQAYLVLYQDDDNYIEIGRGHIGSQRISFVHETGGVPTKLAELDLLGTEVSLRLDRNPANNLISAYYSLNGASWVSLGQTSHSLTNARLGIWTGASLTPAATTQYHCDFSRLDIVTTNTVLTLNYALAVTNTANASVVTNASIAAGGIINWMPDETQGPGVYSFTTAVTDGLYAAINSFTVTVNEVNSAPLLTVPGVTNIMPLVEWSAMASATDADLPGNPLTFELVSGPAGLAVTPAGLISWMPAANQSDSTNIVLVRVTDNNPAAINATSLSVTSSFTVVVVPMPELPILLVTANDTNRSYGVANPVFTASYSGFVNNDDASVLQGVLEFNTSATSGSPVGTYPVQVSGVSSSNYSIVFAAGSLSVMPATASVMLVGLNQIYNGTARVVTANTIPEGLNVNLNYAGSANAPTNVGSYELTGTITELNYVGATTNTLVIAPHPLSVVAQSTSRMVGLTNPVFTGNITGVQSGDNLTATYSSAATVDSPVGDYSIIPTLVDPDGRLSNYTVGVTNGILTIVGAPRFVSINREPTGIVNLVCEVYAGRIYTFQYKDQLTDLDWTTFIAGYAAASSSVQLTNATGANPRRFYRAVDVTNP
jgi:hypothetical protein